jgi:deoxyribodipyrimidine photo-lyase
MRIHKLILVIRLLFEKFYKMKPAAIPDLDSLGFKKSDISVPKKEVNLEIIKKYNQNRDFPGIEGTSRLGMHLRFGTLSIRKWCTNCT